MNSISFYYFCLLEVVCKWKKFSKILVEMGFYYIKSKWKFYVWVSKDLLK